MSKKGNVSWVKPSEPSFLKKFKSDVGYKEGPTVDTKRQELPKCDEDSGDSDREDELPQVVVLKKGDLSAEEVTQIKKDLDTKKDDQPHTEGKILFKKPEKRTSDKFEGITASSSGKKKKQKKSEDDEKKKETKSGVKNNSLLSFGDDEED